MRIVYFDHVAQLSGGEIALCTLIEALGERVDAIAVLAENGPLVERLESVGVDVRVLPLAEEVRGRRRHETARIPMRQATALARYVLRLRRLLREVDADVVHTNSLKSDVYGGFAGRLARVPVVWSVRDRIAPDYLPRTMVRLVRAAARVLPHELIANSAATAATLPRRPVVAYDVPSPAGARAPRGDGPLRIGMAGRLAPWKGQAEFLHAFASAFATNDERAVLIGSALFGEDGYVDSLRELVAELGIGDRVEFRGFRADMAAEYARLDVLVHYSTLPEPFGQVVVEGMAAGLCVLAAAEGGPLEIIADGSNGLLVPPRDPAALATALRRVAADTGLRQSMGAAGARIAERFPPSRCVDPVLDTYTRLTATRSAGLPARGV